MPPAPGLLAAGLSRKIYENSYDLYGRGLQRQPRPGGLGSDSAVWPPHKGDLRREDHTTNNRMELMGVISALRLLKEPCIVELYSDSKYVIDALEKGWARDGRPGAG